MGFYTLEQFRELGFDLPLCPHCEKQYGSEGYLEVHSPSNIPKVKTRTNKERLEIEDCETVLIPLSVWHSENYIHYHGTDFGLPKGSNVLTHEAERYREGCPGFRED